MLKGGLGNQLFQVAAGLSYAIDTSQEFVLSRPLLHEWHASQGESPSVYLNTIFSKIKLHDYTPSNTYTEPGYQFNNIPSNLTDCVLSGYFQSYKYFDHNRRTILDTLCFDHLTRCDMNYDELCSIHVRRGDYTKLKHYHINLDLDYYARAMDIIDCDKFLVFSDDIDWCRSVFTGNQFMFSNEQDITSIIHTMKRCSSNITANSSLSWWGAWLNNNMNNRVIAPKNWFTDPSINTDDLIPEGWILV